MFAPCSHCASAARDSSLPPTIAPAAAIATFVARGNYSAERAERETSSDRCHSSSNAANLTATFLLQFRSHFAQLPFDSLPEKFSNFFLAYPFFPFAHFDQNPLDGKTIADERISFFLPY